MVTDRQVRNLFELLASGRTLTSAGERAGMHRETARRYRRLGKLPSEVAVVHDWRTWEDPFEAVWDEAVEFLERIAGLEHAPTENSWRSPKRLGHRMLAYT